MKTPRKTLLPIISTMGGMIFPALIFISINATSPDVKGWAIDIPTDLAFTLGVATLLGGRKSTSLKIFLPTLGAFIIAWLIPF